MELGVPGLPQDFEGFAAWVQANVPTHVDRDGQAWLDLSEVSAQLTKEAGCVMWDRLLRWHPGFIAKLSMADPGIYALVSPHMRLVRAAAERRGAGRGRRLRGY